MIEIQYEQIAIRNETITNNVELTFNKIINDLSFSLKGKKENFSVQWNFIFNENKTPVYLVTIKLRKANIGTSNERLSNLNVPLPQRSHKLLCIQSKKKVLFFVNGVNNVT